MKLKLSVSILLSLVLGLMFGTAQAGDYKKKNSCDYDLRKGAFFYNANLTPTDGNGNAQESALIVFLRNADGTLSSDIQTHIVPSGGYGNQEGIVTSGQNAVIHTGKGNRQYVFMTNAGHNPIPNKYGKVNKNGSVSVFKVNKCRVRLTSVRSTRGQQPRAVTRHRDRVYVVNAGSGTVEFNGCPGLPEGFRAPTSGVVQPEVICGERTPIPEAEQDPTSIIGYKFKRGKLRHLRGSHVPTADSNGDPAQISFINEGRQVIVAQRATFFALGDGSERDNVEVFNLDKKGRPGKPVVSSTTGNDPFGFSVFPRKGRDYNDCVLLSHGSFQQRDQGGVGVFTVDPNGIKQRIIPNKADGGSDTCWTAISATTNTLYTSAFFDSEISIRGLNPDTCNLVDGGPPVIVSDGRPQFTGAVDPADLEPGQFFAFPTNAGYKHRVSSSAIHKGGDLIPGPGAQGQRDGDITLKTDQTDFLFEAGGLDLAVSKSMEREGEGEYLYAIWAPVPFYVARDGDDNFLYPPTTQVTVFKIIQDCTGVDSIYDDGCRPGDLELVQRVPGLPGSGFGAASN